MKREANFQTRFNHYLKHVYKQTGAFELKQTTTAALPFSALETHQEAALLQVAGGSFVYKIPDCGYQNPFDCFSLERCDAFVVVYYALSGKFYAIAVDEFIHERDHRSERKSLTEDRAKAISTFSG